MLHDFGVYIILIPFTVLCFLPMKNQLKHGVKRTLALITLASLALTGCVFWLRSSFTVKNNVLLVVFLTLYFIAYYKCLKTDLSRALAVYLSVAAIMSILSGYAIAYDAWLHPELTPALYTNDFVISQAVVSFAGLLFLAWPMTHFGSRIVDRLKISSIWLMTLPFMLLLLLMIMVMSPAKYETLHVNRVAIVILSILGSMLFFWLLLTSTFYLIVTAILDAAATSERAKILGMQEQQFQNQQKYMESSARARHDFRQTIRTMQELVHAGDLNAVSSLIDEYVTTLPENDSIRYCNNYALNALLNYYRHMASQSEIRFDVQIDLPDTLRMSDVDLCSMIGNILENAVTACQQANTDDAFIELKGVNRNGLQFIIVVTNSCPDKLNKKDGAYLSTRKNGTGIGLTSVTQTAQEYGGTASFSNEAGRFYSNILIPIK